MNRPAFSNYRIVGGVSATATLALLPFTLIHFANASWFAAAVTGGLNALVAAGSVVVYLFRRRPAVIGWCAIALVSLANLAALLMIEAQGARTAYWIFPIIFANFYLLPFVSGTVVSVAFATLGLLAVAPSTPPDYYLRLLVTTPLCIFFGLVFSRGMTRQRQQLQYLAGHDALTGLGNRHSMDRDLAEAVARKARYGERGSLVLLDIDHFKRINDRLGHLRADEVIVELARMLGDRVRVVDRLYRFGGEEFVLYLPHAAARASWQLAEALRLEVEDHEFGHDSSITISAGVAELANGETQEAWLQRADGALYRAKELGRNRVLAAGEAGKAPGAPGSAAYDPGAPESHRPTGPGGAMAADVTVN